MSVRFRRHGTNTTVGNNDHNQLLNRGVRTHTEIDSYMNELDDARSSFIDLNARLDYIKNNASGGGGGTGGASSKYLYDVVVINQLNQRRVWLTSGTYVVGLEELEVFRGGYRQRRGVDYEETDSNSITFLEDLELGETIVLRIRDRSLSPLGFTDYIFISVGGKDFTAGEAFSTEGNDLEVYLNNNLQVLNKDFTITSDVMVSFVEPTPVGSLICLRVADKAKNEPKRLLQEAFTVSTENVFTLQTFDYIVGANELEVYYNGARLYLSRDFNELTRNSFELTCELVPGEVVAMRENGYGERPNYEIIDARHSELTGQHDTLSSRLAAGESALEQEVADRQALAQDLDSVEGRVATLETEVLEADTTISQRVSNLETKVRVHQVTKLNVTATQADPHIVSIPIQETLDFKASAPSVLKFVEAEDLVRTECAFDNTDASDFQPDDQVIFDGKMHLKTSYPFTDAGAVGAGKLWTLTVTRSKTKKIEGVV